ncbi:hypothetical protein NPIL_648601, partial [Nephila pilipes]
MCPSLPEPPNFKNTSREEGRIKIEVPDGYQNYEK